MRALGGLLFLLGAGLTGAAVVHVFRAGRPRDVAAAAVAAVAVALAAFGVVLIVR